MSVQSKPLVLTPFAAALAGALGGCFSNAVVYPLDVAKTRIQASDEDAKGKGKKPLSMTSVLIDIFKKEGLLGWYDGFAATMLNTFSMQYAYFFFYSFVRNSYITRITTKLPAGCKIPALSTAAELMLGAVAGALAQIFTIPVSVIATRQQVGRQDNNEGVDLSFLGVARDIIKEDGVTGLWLGIQPGLVLTVNPAITYGMFERVKSMMLAAKATAGASTGMTPGLSFVVGALSKTLATVVTYPYIMAKVRIQARHAEMEQTGELPTTSGAAAKKQKHHLGAIAILTHVWKTHGFVGWYQGMSAQIIKAVLAQALLFMSKHQFEQYAHAIMILWARISS